MSDRCFIIAEAGVNHNGNVELAYKLCDAAKEAGADAVKFQTWKTENLITHSVAQAEYQAQNTGKVESQFDMLKRLELPYDDFRNVKTYCDNIGIQFCSTADDFESLEFVASLGVPFLKIGSGDIGNIPFLRQHGSKRIPVILSTGMSTLGDVDISLSALREGGAEKITLLHCTTSYPCPYDSVNLNAMRTLREAFHYPVGYSDHTVGMEVPFAAVALGASVLEKHFTLDRSMEGPDHAASMEPGDFQKMVQGIRHIEVCLGDGVKVPTEEEQEISKVVTKRIVAVREIKKNEVFSVQDIAIKRNAQGLPARYWDMVIGSQAVRDYAVDEGIGWR